MLLESGVAGRIRALIEQARGLLDEGRSREAGLVFGRVLLHDSGCEEARLGLERARAAASEDERRVEARFAEAQGARQTGDREGERQILESILDSGGDRDRALALLDRLDDRAGVVTLPGASAPAPYDAIEPKPRRTLSRRAFGAAWTLLVVTLAAALSLNWETLVGRLVLAPSPSAPLPPPATRLPEPTPGERTLARARRLLDAGDPAGAVSILNAVARDDAAYPFAQQLRAQAESALRESRKAP